VRQSGEFSLACSAISDMSVLAETDSLIKEVMSNQSSPEYGSLFKAAKKFLERTGGSLTVN
jgi:hypothetical protein